MTKFKTYAVVIAELSDFLEKISKRYVIFETDRKNIALLKNKELFTYEGRKVTLNFNETDLKMLEKFLKRLLTEQSFLRDYFKIKKSNQFHQLWSILNIILENQDYLDVLLTATTNIKDSLKMDTRTLLDEVKNSKEYSKLVERNELALVDSERDLNTIMSDLHDKRLVLKTLLITIVARKETHYYTILHILKEMKKRSSLPYDVEELCSIENRVKRRNSWVTDVEAIRICIAHYLYKINDNLSIEFENKKDGFDYSKSFSFSEFVDLYQDLARLFIIFKTALSLINLIQNLRNLLKLARSNKNP